MKYLLLLSLLSISAEFDTIGNFTAEVGKIEYSYVHYADTDTTNANDIKAALLQSIGAEGFKVEEISNGLVFSCKKTDPPYQRYGYKRSMSNAFIMTQPCDIYGSIAVKEGRYKVQVNKIVSHLATVNVVTTQIDEDDPTDIATIVLKKGKAEFRKSKSLVTAIEFYDKWITDLTKFPESDGDW